MDNEILNKFDKLLVLSKYTMMFAFVLVMKLFSMLTNSKMLGTPFS